MHCRHNAIVAAALSLLGAVLGLGSGCSGLTDRQYGGELAALDRLVIFSGFESELIEKYLALFSQKYPEIPVTILRRSNGDLVKLIEDSVKFSVGNPEPIPDLLWGVTRTHIDTLRLFGSNKQGAGIFEKYMPDGIQAEHVRNRTYIDSSNPPLWVGTNAIMGALCVNREKLNLLGITKLPQSWDDLADNSLYNGHIAMPAPDSSATGYMTLIGWLLRYSTAGGGKDLERGWALAGRLLRQIGQVDGNLAYSATGDGACAMAANPAYRDIAVGISLTHIARKQTLMNKVQQPLGNVEMVIIPDTSYEINANALIKKSFMKPAAKIFLDWAVSESIIHQYAADAVDVPISSGRRRSQDLPPNITSYWVHDIDFEWAAAEYDNNISAWRKAR